MHPTLAATDERSALHSYRRVLPAAGLAGACAVAALSPLGDDGQVLCPYRLATGHWCPGCGCTRALGAVVRGDVSASLALNPWTIILLAQAMVISGWFLTAPQSAKAWFLRNDIRVIKVNLVIGLVIWIARMATGGFP